MNIRYQTHTLGEPMPDYLYEGPSLEAAASAARQYAGKVGSGSTRSARCRIVFITHNGDFRPVMDFQDGQVVKGYVYEYSE